MMDYGRILDALDDFSEALIFGDAGDQDLQDRARDTFTFIRGEIDSGDHGELRDLLNRALEAVDSLAGQPGESADALNKSISLIQEYVRTAQAKDALSNVKADLAEVEPSNTPGPVSLNADEVVGDPLFDEFLEQARGTLEEIEQLLLELNAGYSSSAHDALMRHWHNMKGDAGFMGLKPVEELCHAVETAMQSRPLENISDILFEVRDWLAKSIGDISHRHSVPGVPASLFSRLTEGEQVMSDQHTEDHSEEADDVDGENVLAGQTSMLAAELQRADHQDLSHLADIHTLVEQLSASLRDGGHEEPAGHVDVLVDLLNTVIFDEAESPAELILAMGHWFESFSELLNRGEVPEFVEAFSFEAPAAETVPAEDDGEAIDLASAVEAMVEPVMSEPVAEADEPPAADYDEGCVHQTIGEGMEELVVEFVAEANDHLENSDVSLLTLETSPTDMDALDAVFRAFHTIKGVAGFLQLEHILHLAHEAENLLVKARDNELTLEGAAVDVIFESADLLKRLIGSLDVSAGGGESDVTGKELHELTERVKAVGSGKTPEPVEEAEEVNYGRRADDEPAEEAPARLGDILVSTGAADRDVVEQAYTAQQAEPDTPDLGEYLVAQGLVGRESLTQAQETLINDPSKGPLEHILLAMEVLTLEKLEDAKEKLSGKPKIGEVLVQAGVEAQQVAKALRVQKKAPKVPTPAKEYVKIDSDRLNNLIDMIGELVIAESMVTMSPELEDKMSPTLSRHMGQLDKITRDLQELGTSLRMVPVKATFQKMARIVRDLSKKNGKDVELVLSGEDTELDKNLVDKIGDPLVHMVRNAMDHGLEPTSEEREAAGKPGKGTVQLRAFHRGGSIYIEIEDDGRGLDREAILKKAQDQGLITDGTGMEDKDVWNLIFEPGFSTAAQVTEISGRGVGMDVVKRNIQDLRGSVEITSTKGKGSVFSIQLPLTLAIIDGMTVSCGSQRYIIPTLSVKRLMRPEEHDLSTVFKRDRMLNVEGNLVPLFELSKLFRIPDAKHSLEECVIVVVENFDTTIALAVDEVLGQQQTVIKPLGGALSSSTGLSGGAIMTDGTVGLILDPSGLIKLSQQNDDEPALRSA